MEPKIDREELADVIEEASRIEERERARIDVKEVQAILRDLDLPAERLDEARAAVEKRRNVDRAKRKRLWVVGAIASLCVVLGSVVVLHQRQTSQVLARMGASQATVAVAGVELSGPIARSKSPDVSFNVVLSKAPVGNAVTLSCDWSGPEGTVRYQNRWETKTIDRDLWPTHCRHTFAPSDPVGPWRVVLREGDRELAAQAFSLE